MWCIRFNKLLAFCILKQRFTQKVGNSQGARIHAEPTLMHCMALDCPGGKSYFCIFYISLNF